MGFNMVLSSSVRFETIVKQEETERDENTDTTVNLAMPNKTVKREEIAQNEKADSSSYFSTIEGNVKMKTTKEKSKTVRKKPMIEGNVNLKNTKQEGKAVEEKQMEEVVETDAESIQEVNGTDDTCDTEMERESLNDVEDGRDSEKLSPSESHVEFESLRDFENAGSPKRTMPFKKNAARKTCELIERTDGIGESYERDVERELNEKCGNTNASGNLVPLAKQVKEEEDEEKENANGGERLVLFEETVKQEDIGRSEDLDGTGERAVDTEEGEENLAHMRELVKKKGHRKMMLRDKRKEKEQKMKMLRQRRREKKRERELKRQAAIKNKKLQLFCCYVCNRVFSEEDAMKKHLLDKHIGYEKEYILKCDQCYRRFKLKQHLRRHEETHKNTSYACPHCKREFRKEISLEIHLSKVHGRTLDGTKISKTLGCGCGQKFGLKEEFARHRYYCVNREKIFEQRRKARQELEAAARSSVNSTQPASSCPNTASTSSAPGRPLKDKSCPFCFHVYASMQSRRRHIRQIHPERLHDDEVDQHLYIKVNSPSLPYVCEVCAKMFASHASLSTHKRRKHEDLNIHECSVCQKRYPLPSELRKHLKRVHGVQSEV